jgi:hypothetical protein
MTCGSWKIEVDLEKLIFEKLILVDVDLEEVDLGKC